MQTDYKELIRSAFQARKRAYTPYSRFQVYQKVAKTRSVI